LQQHRVFILYRARFVALGLVVLLQIASNLVRAAYLLFSALYDQQTNLSKFSAFPLFMCFGVVITALWWWCCRCWFRCCWHICRSDHCNCNITILTQRQEQIMYAPISEHFAAYFDSSTRTLNVLTVLYFAMYVVFAGPAAWLLSTKVWWWDGDDDDDDDDDGGGDDDDDDEDDEDDDDDDNGDDDDDDNEQPSQ
jgi:hypothetical protein